MAARETNFKCLHCGHEYTGMYDPDNVTERQCPKCRSNSVRRVAKSKQEKSS